MRPGLGAVVFDLFHTLVDPEVFRPRDFDRTEQAAVVLGVDTGEFRRFWEEELLDLVVSPEDPAERAAGFARSRGLEITGHQVARVSEALGRYQDLALRQPIEGTLEALAALRDGGLRLGLLSNAHARDVVVWDRSPLAPRFDAAVFSCFAGVAKPDPAAYRVVLDGLGCDAAEAAFVADGGSGELAGARRNGFGLVVLVAGPALRSGLRTEAEVAALVPEADLRIVDVAELPAVLR